MPQYDKLYVREIEDVVNASYGMCFWKDMEHEYVHANSTTLDFLGYKDQRDIVGKYDADLAWKEFAEDAVLHDKQALCVGEYSAVEYGKLIHSDEIVRCIAYKCIVYGNSNRKAGIFCQAIPLFDYMRQCKKIISTSTDLTETLFNRVQLETSLTPRERECLFLSLSGKSAKLIGRQLGISYRTVESHLVNTKQKLGCTTKSDLFEKIQREA